jgi:hypothetical protein
MQAILSGLESKPQGADEEFHQRLRAMTGTASRARSNSTVHVAGRSRTGSMASKLSYDSAPSDFSGIGPPQLSRAESGGGSDVGGRVESDMGGRVGSDVGSTRLGSRATSTAGGGRSRAMTAVERVVEAVRPSGVGSVGNAANFSNMWLCSNPFFVVVLYFKHIRRRLAVYMVLLFCLSLVIFSSGRHGLNNTLMGVTAGGWYRFSIFFFLLDFTTATLDHMLFYAIDTYWCGDFQLAYSLHAFKSSAGHFLLIIIVSNSMWDMSVPKAISSFGLLISTAVIILMLYSVKNYIQVTGHAYTDTDTDTISAHSCSLISLT